MKNSGLLRQRAVAVISVLFGCIALPMMQPTALATQGTESEGPLTLEPDKPIEREIALNETHSYQIALKAGQYLTVIVDQREADVQIRSFAPDGKRIGLLRRVNTPVPTPVSLIARVSGAHRIEISYVRVPLKITTEAKRYQIRIAELRLSIPEDVSRLTAVSLVWEGVQLLRKGTAESRQQGFNRFEEMLRRYRVAGDTRSEAEQLGGLATMYPDVGIQMAINYGNRALALFRDLGEVTSQISLLLIVGRNYGGLGELDRALEYYQEALALSRSNSDRDNELRALNSLENVYSKLGDRERVAHLQREIEPLLRALAEERAAENASNRPVAIKKTQEADSLSSLGTARSRQKAREIYESVLQLYRTENDRVGEVLTLIKLARVTALVEKQKALDYLAEALRLSKTSQKTLYELSSSLDLFYSIAKAYYDVEEKLKAIEVYSFILEIFRTRTTSAILEPSVHFRISKIYESLGDTAKAVEHLNSILKVLESEHGHADSVKVEARTRIAKIEGDRGNLIVALIQIEAALEIIEQQRTKIVSQDLRASYFASSQTYYEFYIDLLMRLNKENETEGYAIRALQASERARARNLNEVLAEANTNISTGVDRVLLDRRKKLQEQLNANAAGVALSGVNLTREQRVKSNREIWELTSAYHQVEAQIRQRNPQYSALTQPISLTLSQIQELLDSDTVLLEYSLGTERSYLWLVTPTSFASYELPAQSRIEDEVKRVVALFNDGTQWATNNQTPSKYASVSTLLSQMLFPKPARRLFRKRLLLVPHGALQYLAFGALPTLDSKARRTTGEVLPMISDYEIVTIPSVSTLAVLRSESKKRSPALKSVIVMADPVFDRNDERVSKPNVASSRPAVREKVLITNATAEPITELQRSIRDVLAKDKSGNAPTVIRRLPFSREEANAIFSIAPRGEAIRAVDFEANRANATNQTVARARVVHFASHGLLNSEHPELSGIVLSLVNKDGEAIDGFLRLHEIYNLNLSADLVVLSACQTALGREIRGEGLVGLTRGFMYAGAPRVIASLWKVDDVSTAELMKIFYRKMLRERKSPSAALREAQLEMWRSKRWRLPYYWAAFQLQGDWK